MKFGDMTIARPIAQPGKATMASKGPSRQRVLVVDKSATVRSDIRRFLESTGGFEVVGEAANPNMVIELATVLEPEIVLLDLGVAQENGFDLLFDLLEELPSASVVVTTEFDDLEYAETISAVGAAAVVNKAHLFDTLVPTLEAVLDDARPTSASPLPEGEGESLPPTRSGGEGPRWLSKIVRPRSSRLTASGKRQARPEPWWKPRTWREWFAGVATLAWAAVRAAPMDSAPSKSYWGYIEVGMLLAGAMLLGAQLSGQFADFNGLSKALIVAIVVVLAGEQARQLRRVALTRRAMSARYDVSTTRKPTRPDTARTKGGDLK